VNADEHFQQQLDHEEWEELLASDPGYLNWIESLNNKQEKKDGTRNDTVNS